MTTESKESLNILDLPNEVLMRIMYFTPNCFVVATTCKKFYEIICTFGDHKMDIKNCLPMDKDRFSDDVMFGSMMNTKKKVTMMIYRGSKKDLSQKSMNRFKKLIKRHASTLEEVILTNFIMTLDFLPALNHLTNVREIRLINVNCVPFRWSFRLGLSNLRVLRIETCNEYVLNVFDLLPNEVLEELSATEIKKDSNKFHLLNQRTIKTVHVTNEKHFNFRMMKLKRLQIDCPLYIEDVILGQNELIHLSVNDGFGRLRSLEPLRKELTSIEELFIYFSNPPDLTEISNMPTLKSFDVTFNCFPYEGAPTLSQGIEMIQSKYLKDLKLTSMNGDITKDEITMIACGCPNLRELRIETAFSSLVNFVLQKFPELEDLSYVTRLKPSIDDTPNDFEHHNLNGLQVECSQIDLSRIVTCKKLTTVGFKIKSVENQLAEYLMRHPNIDYMTLEANTKVDSNFVAAIDNYGKKINRMLITVGSRKYLRVLKDELKDFYEHIRVPYYENPNYTEVTLIRGVGYESS